MMIYIIFAFIRASKAHTMCMNCISTSVKLNHTYCGSLYGNLPWNTV